VSAPKLAAVFAKYEVDQGNQADNMARDMAVSAYLKQSNEIRHRHIVPIYSLEGVTNGVGWNTNSSNIRAIGESTFRNDVLPKAQSMYEEMLEMPGATAPRKLGVEIDTEGEQVTVYLHDKDSKAVAGHQTTVELKGATFADGGTTKTITSGDKAAKLDIDIDKAGTIEASASVENIPSDQVVRWTPRDYTDEKADSASPNLNPNMGTRDGYNRYSVQEVYEKDEPYSLNASTEESVENSPNVITTINNQNLKPGDYVYDNFTVSGLVGDDVIDVRHELWYSPVRPEESTDAPQEGHILLGEVTSSGVGNGDHRTDETAQLIQIPEDLPQGGYFYFYEESPESDTSDGWKGKYGIPDETGFVPYLPSGETQISDMETDTLPIEIHDDGRITGGMPGMEMPVTLQAYKDADCTIEQSPEVPEDAELLGTTVINVTFDENGEATYQTDKLQLAEELAAEGECAAVTIVEHLPKTDYTEPKTSDYGIPNESILIDRPAPPAPPENPEQPEAPNPAPPNPIVKTGATERSGTAIGQALHTFTSALSGLLK
jgi:hypothetical protein